MTQDEKNALADVLATKFNHAERRNLLRELGVPPEDVTLQAANGRDDAWHIVEYFERRDRLDRLWAKVQRERPAALVEAAGRNGSGDGGAAAALNVAEMAVHLKTQVLEELRTDLGLPRPSSAEAKADASDIRDVLAAARRFENGDKLLAEFLRQQASNHEILEALKRGPEARRAASSPGLWQAFSSGFFSAIFIPAFDKYVRRSKTTEATMNLRKLFDSAIVFYESERADEQGRILPRGFPPSVGWTPADGACAHPGARYPVRPELWQHPTWVALNFSIDDPSYYAYRFDSKPSGFVASARGDLNCDGKFSLFRRSGRIDAGGNVIAGPLEIEDAID